MSNLTSKIVASDQKDVWNYRDLVPDIHRQRLVVEGVPMMPVDSLAMIDYLERLSVECGMKLLISPVVHMSEKFGWAAWVHWETSGAHVYAWERPQLFLSVDMYTCKAFDSQRAMQFTADYFQLDPIVAKDF